MQKLQGHERRGKTNLGLASERETEGRACGQRERERRNERVSEREKLGDVEGVERCKAGTFSSEVRASCVCLCMCVCVSK